MMDLRCIDIVHAHGLGPGIRKGQDIAFPCVLHKDGKNPNLSIDEKKNVWICRVCNQGGNSWELAAACAGTKPDDKAAVISWLAAKGLNNGNGKPAGDPYYIRLWNEAILLTADNAKPGRQYLRNRGLQLSDYPADVHFHPQLPYFNEQHTKIGEYPGLIFLVRDKNSNSIGAQRIYLTADGKKADVPEVKKSIGPISGGAIYFGAQDGSLNIAEGPETALAVYQATGMPTCSTVSASGMSNFEIPEKVKTVTVWADADRSEAGQNAANELAARAYRAGKTVFLQMPAGLIPEGKKSQDWLDVLNADGPESLQREMEKGEPWAPPAKASIIHWAKEALEPQPPKNEIIKDLVGEGDILELIGNAGGKKTWTALDVAVCVALGKNWLGRHVTRSNVLIVDEESGARRLKMRLGNCMRGHEAGPDTPIAFTTLAGITLSTDAGMEQLSQIIDETKAQFIIIDALQDLTRGMDENSGQELVPVMHRLRRIAEKHHCAIWVIHHLNKAGAYRGHSSIKDQVDVMLKCESATESSLIEFVPEKSRDCLIVPFAAQAHFDLGRFWLSDADPKKELKKWSRPQSYVLDYLKAQPESTGTMTDIMEKADRCSAQSARQAVYTLASMGLLERIDSGGRGVVATYKLKGIFI